MHYTRTLAKKVLILRNYKDEEKEKGPGIEDKTERKRKGKMQGNDIINILRKF